MIFSSIEVESNMKFENGIKLAMDFLKNNDLETLEPGVYEIDGRDIFAQVFNTNTQSKSEKRAESHREYVDLQYLVKGEELIGITNNNKKYDIDEYIEERDLIFYKSVEDEGYIHVKPKCFSIFFPEDIHRPEIAVKDPIEIKKVVIKIRLNRL